MIRVALLTAAIAALIAAPNAAGQAPFGPLPTPAPSANTTPAAPVTQAPVQQVTAPSSSSSLSTPIQVLIFVSALALLALIAWLIVRDARTHAPLRGTTGERRDRGTVTPRAKRVNQARGRGKAARAQRRRNR